MLVNKELISVTGYSSEYKQKMKLRRLIGRIRSFDVKAVKTMIKKDKSLLNNNVNFLSFIFEKRYIKNFCEHDRINEHVLDYVKKTENNTLRLMRFFFRCRQSPKSLIFLNNFLNTKWHSELFLKKTLTMSFQNGLYLEYLINILNLEKIDLHKICFIHYIKDGVYGHKYVNKYVKIYTLNVISKNGLYINSLNSDVISIIVSF